MIDGEMLFELEGEAPRVLRAGDAFWGPGGDVIHYQDANNRTDIPCSFVLTMFCVHGQPMLERVTEEELEGERDCASPVDWLEHSKHPDGSSVLCVELLFEVASRVRVNCVRSKLRGLGLREATSNRNCLLCK